MSLINIYDEVNFSEKNLSGPPTPISPIDEFLLEFMYDDLKKEQWPAFDKDFYSKLFKLQMERNIENFVELDKEEEKVSIKIPESLSFDKLHTHERSSLRKINPIQIEKPLFTSRPFHCKFLGCGYKATQSCHLTRHMRSHKIVTHKAKGIYPCQYSGCNYSTNKCVLLKNHMHSHTN